MSSEQMVAIITGASQGIGAGVVQAYRQLGYVVVANSRHITPSSDPGVLTVPGDIADPETGARLVDRAVDCFGRVDTLVNNAGVFVAKPFTDYTDADFDLVTGVNLGGFFSVTRPAIAAMLRNKGTLPRPRGQHLHQPHRPRQHGCSVRACVAYQGRPQRGYPVPGHRVRSSSSAR
jgi:NAD(P)-dependent dehydrogenase (short-subunit alcohol dehydrogenase family)